MLEDGRADAPASNATPYLILSLQVPRLLSRERAVQRAGGKGACKGQAIVSERAGHRGGMEAAGAVTPERRVARPLSPQLVARFCKLDGAPATPQALSEVVDEVTAGLPP